MENIKVTGMHSNIYTNIIFIDMGVKVTVYTGKYPEIVYFTEIHAIITQAPVIFLVSPWITRVLFFPCKLDMFYCSMFWFSD